MSAERSPEQEHRSRSRSLGWGVDRTRTVRNVVERRLLGGGWDLIIAATTIVHERISSIVEEGVYK